MTNRVEAPPDARAIVERLTPSERRNFSYVKLINALASERKNDPACLELEISNELAKALPVSPQPGKNVAYCPLSLNPSQRSGLDSKSGSAGGFLGQVGVGDILDLLRGRNLMLSLGATFLQLPYSLSLPVEISGSTSTWVNENPGSDLSDSDASFSARTATPHSLLTTTAFSRRLLSQSSNVIEAFVRRDLASAIASALDIAAINGSGLENQPLGILGTSGVSAVVGGSNGATPDFDDLVDLEYDIANANDADTLGTLSYVTTAGVRKLLKKTAQVSGSSLMCWQGNQVNGYSGYTSTHVPSTLSKGSSVGVCHAIIAGIFSELVIAEFGNSLSLIVDPFRLKKSGMVEVSAYLDCDCIPRRPECFAVMSDALLS